MKLKKKKHKVYPKKSTKIQKGSRDTAILFYFDPRLRWVVYDMTRPLYPPGKRAGALVQETGWTPGPVWKGTENLVTLALDPRSVQPVTSLCPGPRNILLLFHEHFFAASSRCFLLLV